MEIKIPACALQQGDTNYLDAWLNILSPSNNDNGPPLEDSPPELNQNNSFIHHSNTVMHLAY